MVSRFFKFLSQEVRGLHEAAYLLAFFSLLSQLLALLRDRLLAGAFGAGETLDLYYAAFRIPDLVFVGVASLVSVYVLIPFLAERMDNLDALRAFLKSAASFFGGLVLVVTIPLALLAPWLLHWFFPIIMEGPRADELVLLTRILLLQPILLGFSSLFASVTQAYHKFVLYSASPILYNLGIIAGIIAFYPIFGVAGLGYGVVLGAFLHLAIQAPFLIGEGLLPLPTVRVRVREMVAVIRTSLPRTLALSVSQLILLALVAFASRLTEGSIAVFTFGFNLHAVPLTIIGVSYSVAAFPTLARLFSTGDREAFFAQIVTASRHIIFWSFPAIVLFIVLRAQIVRVILGSGHFDWSDTRLTAAALALFVISISAQALVLLITRGYYAAGHTAKPLMVNLSTSAFSVLISWLLLQEFQSNLAWQHFFESVLRVEGIPGTALLMLPLGYSIGAFLNSVVLLSLFQHDFQQFSEALTPVVLKTAFASFMAGLAAYLGLQLLADVFNINTFLGIFSQGALAGIAGLISGIAALRLTNSRELDETWRALRSKIWKPPVVLPEQEV